MAAPDSTELIPHRGRMKLVGPILELSSDIAVTSAVVSRTWPLCTGDSVSPITLIEVVAQTAGILSSWKKGVGRSAYTAGWLTGIKNADFFIDTVPVGAEIITTVTCRYSLEDYEAMSGTIMSGKRRLCIIELQIFGLKAASGALTAR